MLKFRNFPELWRAEIVGMKLFRRQKHWPCESWLTNLNMGKKFQNSKKCLQSQHESMAFNQSPSSPRCVAPHWLDNQTPIRHIAPQIGEKREQVWVNMKPFGARKMN